MSKRDQMMLFDMTPVAIKRREKTRTTRAAKELLEATRSKLIAKGREVARKIAAKEGTVHSRQVRAALADEGLLNNPNLGDYWLGAVFQCGDFEWTGVYHKYSDSERNIHERTVKLWRLARD